MGYPRENRVPLHAQSCSLRLSVEQALPAGLRDNQGLSRAGRSSACELHGGASHG